MYERRNLKMEKRVYFPSITIKHEAFLLKWEGAITALVTLCAVVAIVLGIVWLFLRKDTLLFTTLGFSYCYLAGKNFWKFRSRGISFED
jgi:ABC-type branched-subunit amino acid transport system permease subunit